MTFEWDQSKNQSNQMKHGLSFELARHVFNDPLAILQQDPGHHKEDRWRIIGKIHNTILALVVYVVKDEGLEVIRIISARRVTTHERKKYEES